MARILFIGDGPNVDTGFGIVAKNLLNRWAKMGHEIVALGVNFFGDPYDSKQFPYPIYPTDRGSIDLLYGYHKFWPLEEKVQPDIIFFLNDPWIIERYLSFKPKGWTREGVTKLVAYYPTDAGPFHKEWAEMFNKFDAQICYSKFAERLIIEANEGIKPNNLYQIYHGVDTEIFYPINTYIARQQASLAPDTFIVGMVARNQYRKRFDILAQGFAEFAKDKKNTKLYLHTALQDVGFGLPNLVKQLKIEDKLIVTRDITPVSGVPPKMLNLIYNCFDINCLISLGDGFGLPVAESMAVGAPQVVSGHSCLEELVEGHGGLTVKTSAWLMNTGGFNTWGGLSDYKDVAEKLNILYENEEMRQQMGIDGYNFITQEIFNWDYAASEFNKIFKKVLHIL